MKIRKDRRRGAYTYCALICSDPSIQPFLPHFLISSQTRLPSSLLRAYNALPRTQLQIIRGKSSWVTADCMLVILQAVKKALMPFLAGISAFSRRHLTSHNVGLRVPTPAENYFSSGKATWISITIYTSIYNKFTPAFGRLRLLALQVVLASEVPRTEADSCRGAARTIGLALANFASTQRVLCMPQLVGGLQVCRDLPGCFTFTLSPGFFYGTPCFFSCGGETDQGGSANDLAEAAKDGLRLCEPALKSCCSADCT